MGMQNEGKNAILEEMLTGASLKLGNISNKVFTPIAQNSTNPNYAPMLIQIFDGNLPANPDSQKLYLKISDGVAKNTGSAAYFKDADDGETQDSLTPLSEGGWQETVTAVGLYRGNTLYYACQFSENPIHVYQGHRIRIGKNQFSLTLTVQPPSTSSMSDVYRTKTFLEQHNI